MLKICQKSNKIINKEGLGKNKYRNLAGPKVLCYHSVTLTSWFSKQWSVNSQENNRHLC